MLEKVEMIINEWDPLGLFPYAPKDEYRLEVKELVTYLENEKICSIEKLGKKIYELFLRTLEKDVFTKTIENCMEIAQKILENTYTN